MENQRILAINERVSGIVAAAAMEKRDVPVTPISGADTLSWAVAISAR